MTISATGGIESTVTIDGVTYQIHTFTSSGTLSVTTGGEVEYLVVGGGGGGGDRHGGGGGGGGFLTGTLAVSTGNIAVTVGAGGTAGSYELGPTAFGGRGGNSSFSSIIALGGGGGGTYDGNPTGSFGSGGGGGGNGLPGIAGTAGQGNSGGSGSNPAGGGGGGAGGPGGNANNGSGGVGLASSITGELRYYAGGGGGGWAADTGPATPGGLGGGGAGDWNDTNIQAGQANTGGGGGGSRSSSTPSTGRPGGSGIVVIRYVVATGLRVSSSSAPTSAGQGSTFTVSIVTSAADGEQIPYVISGVTSADINNASLTGNFNVSGGAASIQIVTTQTLPRSNKTLTITIDEEVVKIVNLPYLASNTQPAFGGTAEYSGVVGNNVTIDKYLVTSLETTGAQSYSSTRLPILDVVSSPPTTDSILTMSIPSAAYTAWYSLLLGSDQEAPITRQIIIR